MTKNHGYNQPAEGTTDWHIPLNDNFAKIDADVEIRDVDAAKSNYTPKSDAKFLATDTGDVYIGDGSDWNHLGNLSSDTGDFSTVSASQFEHRPNQTVENDNIVPRGIVSTEDIELYVSTSGSDSNSGTQSEPLASIQEAFDRLPFICQHDVRIKIEPGTYDCNSTINTGMHWVNHVVRPDNMGRFKVIGLGDVPSDTHLTGNFWWNVGIRGDEPKNTVIENVEMDGKVQNYNACFGLRDCIINVSSNHGAAAKTGVDGYAGITRVEGCQFNTEGAAVRATSNHDIAVAYSDASNAGDTYVTNWGGDVWWHGSNTPS